MRRFENKVALVTGAGGGIGQATALRLASEGALVAVNEKRGADTSETMRLIEGAGGRGIPVVADVRDTEEVVDMVQQVVEIGTRLDYVVANAAVNLHISWNQMTAADWDVTTETNLRGTWLVATEAAKKMVAGSHGGAIVCVSSISAHVGGGERSAYCASKGGVSMLSKALGAELGQYGIRVNCVEPGAIETKMSQRLKEDPVRMNYYVSRIPLRRVGQPGEVAAVIAFLLSDDASYVTSATLAVDAGFMVNAEL